MTSDDKKLIARYLDGEEARLAELIKLYLKPIYNFVYRMITNREEAEDITQEVFIKMWRNLKKYNPEKEFKTWLFAIAQNTTIDKLRKKREIPFSDLENDEEEGGFVENIKDEELLPDEIVARAEDAKFLNELLDKINPLYRQVLILHYLEDFSFEEMSNILQKPQETVRSQHRRALLALRKIINNKVN